MLKLMMSALVCVSAVSACNGSASKSETKDFGTDISENKQPFEVSEYSNELSLSDDLVRSYRLLSASAGAAHMRNLWLFNVASFSEKGTVLAEAGTLSYRDIVAKERLHFVSHSAPVVMNGYDGFLLNYIDPRGNQFPIAFINSYKVLSYLCDGKAHSYKNLGDDSRTESVTFDCDINLKENFSITVNKTDAEKKGETYEFLSPTIIKAH